MSTPIRWKHGRARRRPAKLEPRPLNMIKTALGEMARAAVAEPFMLSIERQEIFLRRLPKSLDGFRIVHLSDFHYGPMVNPEHLKRAVRAANELHADLIALTGDYISQDRGYAAPCAEVVGRLRAKHGVYAVLGNHDHWTDAGIVHGALAERGITVLRNASTLVERGGKRLWIAGVEDAYEGEANLSAAIARIPAGEATILLAHEPDYADFVSHSEVDLQLSGHSYGGQVSIPGVGPLILPRLGRKYHTGHYCIGPLQLYTSRGVGVINPPVRFNCPPEVTLITLKSAA